MSHSLPHLTLTTGTSSLSPISSTSPIFPTVSPAHTRSMILDPTLPCDVPRQSGGPTQIPSPTAHGHVDQRAVPCCSTGQHLVGSSSTTQNVVALSSGESEFHGLAFTCFTLPWFAGSRVRFGMSAKSATHMFQEKNHKRKPLRRNSAGVCCSGSRW